MFDAGISYESLAALYFPDAPDLQQLYIAYAAGLRDELRDKPGARASHHMMIGHLAYLYVKSLEIAGDSDATYFEEKSYLASFNALFREYMKELRTLSTDESIRRSVVDAVSSIINVELLDYPDLRSRIASRLAAIG